MGIYIAIHKMFFKKIVIFSVCNKQVLHYCINTKLKVEILNLHYSKSINYYIETTLKV